MEPRIVNHAIAWLLFLATFVGPVCAEEKRVIFSAEGTISVAEGLANPNVSALVNEPSGLVWAGTPSGINRLDGYDIGLFSQPLSADSVFPINSPTAMLIDRQNKLWVGTWSQGLGWIEHDRKSTHVFDNVSESNGIPLQKIQALFESESGYIWIGTHDEGLIRFDPVDESFESFKSTHANTATLSNNIQHIAQDESGKLWVGTAAGVRYYDGQSKHLTDVEFDEDLSLSERLILSMEIVDGSLWLGSASGFMEYNIASKTLTKHEPDGYVSTSVNDIVTGEGNGLWLATFNGLMHFNTANRTFSKFADGAYTYSTGTEINSLLTLRPHTLILATRQSGLISLNTHESMFQTVAKNVINQAQSQSVLDMTEDQNGNIWLGTGSGLMLYEPGADQFKPVPYRISDAIKTRVPAIASSHEGSKIWLSANNDIYSFDTGNNLLRSYRHLISRDNYVRIRKIFVDKHNGIWISAAGQNIVQLRDNEPITYSETADSSQAINFANEAIVDILEDSSGRIWLLTANSQLLVLNNGETEFTLFEYADNQRFYFDDIATGFSFTNSRQILISTFTGLLIVDLSTKTSSKITVEQDLASNELRGIVTDKDGYVWLPSSVGVTRYLPNTKEISHYSLQDGLSSTNLNIGATLLSRDNTLYFGTDKGLQRVNTTLLDDLQAQTPVHITDIWVNNQKLTNTVSSSVNNTLLLQEDQRNLTLKYGVYDHRPNATHQFYYSLTGFDDQWQRGNISRTATYTNLAAGHYAFKVRVSGANSSLSYTQLNIHIAPSIFENTWVRFAIIFSICLFIFTVFKVRFAAMSRNENRLNKLVISRTQNMLMLSEIGQEITHSLGFDDILDKVRLHLGSVLHSNLIMIGILNESNNTVEFQKKGGSPKDIDMVVNLHNLAHPVVQSLRLSETVLLNTQDEVRTLLDSAKGISHKQHRAAIIQPLAKEDKKLGCLCIFAREAFAFSNYDQQFLTTISSYTAIALDNAIVSSQQRHIQQQRINWLENINNYLRHEMKNAMLGAKTSIAMVRRKLADGEMTKYLNRADQSHEEMRNILNAVADTTSIEVAIMRAKKHKVELSESLKDRIDYFSMLHPSIQINANIDPNIVIHGNRELMDQLVDKLIDNAIEHHTEKTSISFTAQIINMQCHIAVKNIGPPLPQSEQNIFDLFVSTKAEKNGTNMGMGLYIVKLITEFHNGKVNAVSILEEQQTGALFTVTLPTVIAQSADDKSYR